MTYDEKLQNRIKIEKDWYLANNSQQISFLLERKYVNLNGCYSLEQLKYIVARLENLDRLENPDDCYSDSEDDPDKIGY